MNEWLNQLSRRERTILAWGALVALALLLYTAVTEPLEARLRDKRESAEAQMRLLVTLQGVVSSYNGLSGEGGREIQGRDASLLTVIDQSAGRNGLKPAIKRLSPEGDDKVRLRLETAPFDPLARWLATLTTDYGIRVDTITVRAGERPGQVDGNLVLQRN